MHIPFIKQSPPATIIVAGYDPLRDEGRDYAERLRLSYVDSKCVYFGSMLHGFLGMEEYDPEVTNKIDDLIQLIKEAFTGNG
jgi:acetyl esterase